MTGFRGLIYKEWEELKKYYLEAEAGVAGDMLVGALLDLGADKDNLIKAIASLPLDGYEIKISRVKKAGIDACDFDVVLDEDNHDHDMEYLHGDGAHENHEHHHHDHEHHHHDHHVHEHEHDHHHHDHDHGHDHHQHNHNHEHHHEHSHVHRHLKDIYKIIDGGKLSGRARSLAKDIFRVVAEAESKSHGIPVEEVHFHEVGAVDSIVDIVAIAVCIDDLGIEEMIIPYLCEGNGTVRCAHGILPIPVPAVEHIVSDHSIPLRRLPVMGEFVTPTGAAACAALRSGDKLPTEYIIKKTGYGAGKRNYERASLLRLMEIEVFEEKSDFVWKLETDIDDCTGERLGAVMDELFAAGAREVHYTPVHMKKNRPGVEMIVICDDESRKKLENIIFLETTTIGIRRIRMERTILLRRQKTIETEYGQLLVKEVEMPDGSTRMYPENDSLLKLSDDSKKSVSDVLKCARQQGVY